ncbi:MAG: exodeoxyribonuclease V subunit alpha [Candidatus Binataceae bacterium]
MDERYRHLGLTTAWMRYQAADDAQDDGGEFRRRLRQIESGAGALNLESGAIHVAAEVAALEPDLDDERRLVLIALIAASMVALQEGSTRLPVVGPQARAPMGRILSALCGDALRPAGPETIAAAIQTMLDSGDAPHVIGRNPDAYRPLIYLRPFIYHHRVRLAELRLAALLGRRLSVAHPADTDQHRLSLALADVAGRPGGSGGRKLLLSDEQRDAVAKAAGHKMALISGGPGTGKTSIILAILRVLVRIEIQPERIALAAPTGKAAFRMGESVAEGLARIDDPTDADRLLKLHCPEPATIHRLLGYSPSRRRFNYHRNNPLDAAAVIVDEGSMLDLSLTERLVGALKPDARLIILGDADQLPSVAAGAVFRDLVSAAGESAAQPLGHPAVCTRLTHSYRMDTTDPAGRGVFDFASAINSAGFDATDRTGGAGLPFMKRSRPDDLRFEGVELLAGTATVEAFLDRWYAARLRSDEIEAMVGKPLIEDEQGFDEPARVALERIFGHFAASRVLCFTRVLSTGTERINASLHRRRAETAGFSTGPEFLPGEPVIVVRNDYERMLFNGDQGVILRIRRSGARAAAMAVFKRGRKFEAFHVAALRESLELCYATTIHKAQGSEFDSVAIVMPERDLPILTREALYTGVTRSRKSVVIAGQEDLLRTGIARGIERFSGLGEELVNALGTKA